jgi:hypothetical protein
VWNVSIMTVAQSNSTERRCGPDSCPFDVGDAVLSSVDAGWLSLDAGGDPTGGGNRGETKGRAAIVRRAPHGQEGHHPQVLHK